MEFDCRKRLCISSFEKSPFYISKSFFRIEVSVLKTAKLANEETNFVQCSHQEECESGPVAAEELPLVSVDHDQGADDAGMWFFVC